MTKKMAAFLPVAAVGLLACAAPAWAAEGGHGPGILDIDFNAVLVQAIAFIVLVFVLGKVAFRPVTNMLDARTTEVQTTLDQIAADRRAMEESRADYERRLAAIEAEAREHIQGAVKEAQQLREQMITDARTEADNIVTRGRDEIVREKQRALIELRTEVADLALTAASKIVGRSLDDKTHRDLIGDVIEQVGARPQ